MTLPTLSQLIGLCAAYLIGLIGDAAMALHRRNA